MNVCITCCLNEPSNTLLYYFYIVFVYFCMHIFFCSTSNPRKLYYMNEFLRKFDTISLSTVQACWRLAQSCPHLGHRELGWQPRARWPLVPGTLPAVRAPAAGAAVRRRALYAPRAACRRSPASPFSSPARTKNKRKRGTITKSESSNQNYFFKTL